MGLRHQSNNNDGEASCYVETEGGGANLPLKVERLTDLLHVTEDEST